MLVASSGASLIARECSLANTRNAIASERAGRIDVRNCSIELSTHDVGFKLAADTSGVVCHNRQVGAGSLWGRLPPPHTMRLMPPEEDGVVEGQP